MNIPMQLKPALWGAFGGAVALAIIGFNWGGWVLGATAEQRAENAANEAVVAALAPIAPTSSAKHRRRRQPGRDEENQCLAAGLVPGKGRFATLPGASLPDWRWRAPAPSCSTRRRPDGEQMHKLKIGQTVQLLPTQLNRGASGRD